MPMAATWIGYKKSFGTDFFLDGDSANPFKKSFACKLSPNPNDDHAHGSGMDWLSKNFGAEKFWMAIPLIPLKTDRFQDRPKPER